MADPRRGLTIRLSRTAVVNARLQDDYISDCEGGVGRWNKVIADSGVEFSLDLPHRAFNRQIGNFVNLSVDATGEVMPDAEFEKRQHDWLPNPDDLTFIAGLMKPEREPGKFAGWIAPPRVGIDNKPGDFDYVRIHD